MLKSEKLLHISKQMLTFAPVLKNTHLKTKTKTMAKKTEKVKYLVYQESVCDYGTDRHFWIVDDKEKAKEILEEAWNNDAEEFSAINTKTSKTEDEYQFWEEGEWLCNHCVGKIIPIVPNTSDDATYSELF